MKAVEVLELVRAGYSKDEILKFESDESFSESAPEVKEGLAESKPEVAPESTPEVKPELREELANTLMEMNKVLKEIQSNNLRYSNYPETPGRTPEDIIGEIISPSNYLRKGE